MIELNITRAINVGMNRGVRMGMGRIEFAPSVRKFLNKYGIVSTQADPQIEQALLSGDYAGFRLVKAMAVIGMLEYLFDEGKLKEGISETQFLETAKKVLEYYLPVGNPANILGLSADVKARIAEILAPLIKE